ncbi:Bug family tripartite tricarboxylate transporter substrate binding protein [Alicycliphilus sp. T452]|jgi:tripartite-type tricarboxylate transporter receptor subunit TctC
MNPIKTQALRTLWAVTLAALPLAAGAQAFPSKPIVLINPYAVGGPADQLARVLAKGMGDQLGQPVVVESKAGGGAAIGAAFVAKAPADGYTLLLGTSAAHVVTPTATKVTYDGIKDFDFLGIVANVPNVLTVHPSVEAKTLPEFIALAKGQPGKLNYASAGMGSSPHIGMELFKYKTGTSLLHIPYRGAAPATTDMVAGTVPVGLLNVSSVQGFIKSNRLRALAYGGSKRSAGLPDVPTFAEAGLPNLVTGSWYSLAAPAGTPAPVLDQLTKALVKTQASPEFVSAAAQQNAEIYHLTPAQTVDFVRDDAKTVQELVKAMGMKLTD